mmetsp:Transcript_108427/g.258745  ORF Transcript_108427/g.258745 Transcript_108427/m.258745 type:complete len:230 (+) Transcript_108427:3287-3976(+)
MHGVVALQAHRRGLANVAVLLAVRAGTARLGFSLREGVVGTHLHALPAGRQVLEVHALRARVLIGAGPAVHGALGASVAHVCVAYLVVAYWTLGLTPKVRVQIHGVLALRTSARVLALVAVPRTYRTLVADEIAVQRVLVITVWAGRCTLRLCGEIQVVLAFRGEGCRDALVEVLRALLADPAVLLVAHLVVSVLAVLHTLAGAGEEVGVVAHCAGGVADALKAILRAG